MPREILATSYSEEEFEELLRTVIKESIREEVGRILKERAKPDKLFFNRSETAGMLGISLPTLHLRTLDGSIVCRRIGRKVLYKWEDIESALKTFEEKKADRFKRK